MVCSITIILNLSKQKYNFYVIEWIMEDTENGANDILMFNICIIILAE
jgi:hypothetical protein